MDPVLDAKTIEDYATALEQAPQCVLPVSSLECTNRMAAQQGTYTLTHSARLDHRQAIGEACSNEPGTAVVAIIPKDVKRYLMQELHDMNISGSTLFPGIDGVGRSVRETAEFALSAPPLLLAFGKEQPKSFRHLDAESQSDVGGSGSS